MMPSELITMRRLALLMATTATALHLPTPLARAPTVRMGLLDWMLDEGGTPPLQQLTRANGWDLALNFPASGKRLNIAMVFQREFGDTANSPMGAVELTSSVAELASVGTWRSLEMADDGSGIPTKIEWCIEAAADATASGASADLSIVSPGDSLYCTLPVVAGDGVVLRDGYLSLTSGGPPIGTASVSPVPLMGRN